MLLATTDGVAGRQIIDVLGIVIGNAAWVPGFRNDIMTTWPQVTGGEVTRYTELLSTVRQHATDRMVEQARSLGADAVVGIRLSESSMGHGTAELVVYGTAVRLE